MEYNNYNFITTYYDNGEIKEEYYLLNNMKDGQYKEFYDNGNIYIE